MKLKRLSGGCFDGTCPTVYQAENGNLVIQGWKVTEADVDVPDGEALVEIPAELLKQINA
jgi:hypothetical protein